MTAASATPLVTLVGRYFVFLHNGREIWDCSPLGADAAGRIVVKQLSEKRWFTDSHHEQFAALVADRFGAGGR